jgi:hypothetical protein
MISLDQLDRLYKTNQEVFEKASEKYPLEVAAYKISNNLGEINLTTLDAEDCSKIIKMLAFDEDANIPIELLNKLGRIFPGEFGSLLQKSMVENLPLSDNVLKYIANNKHVCTQAINYIIANSWYKLPHLIIKAAIEKWSGIDFCSNVIYYCLEAERDPVEVLGDKLAREAIEKVALDYNVSSRMIIKNILLNERFARNFKECYYPLFDNKVNAFLNDKTGWFYGVLYNMVKRHIPIPPFIWNQIDDKTKKNLKYEMKNSGDYIDGLYDSLTESFKEFFKRRS